MNTERIKQKLANGFRPFALELSSGKRYFVPHPDFIMIGKSVVVIMGEDESVTTIDPLHIVAIQDIPATRRKK